MEEICAYCRYCDCTEPSNSNNQGKYPCERERVWVYADGKPIKSNCFWARPSYQMLGIDRAISVSRNARRFYITTYIYNKLGLTETNKTDLETLYLFRNTFLQSNPKGSKFLSDYDTFAPRIAKLLELIDQDGSIAKRLYEFYILGTLKCIKEGNLDEACELYASMYDHLKQEYVIAPLMEKRQRPFIKVNCFTA